MHATLKIEGKRYKVTRRISFDETAHEALDALHREVAEFVVLAQDELARARGAPLPSAAIVAAAAAREGRPRGDVGGPPAPRRRSALPPVTLPAAFAMPAQPVELSHPSQRRAYQLGVLAGVEGGAKSCPYGEKGLGPACGRAWTFGLRDGERMRARAVAAPA